jgi:hypothetical protein
MSTTKSIPEGLKPQECERGRCTKPPIAYIPEKKIINSHDCTLKIKVSKNSISPSPSSIKELQSNSSVICKWSLKPSTNSNLTWLTMMPVRKEKRQKKSC